MVQTEEEEEEEDMMGEEEITAPDWEKEEFKRMRKCHFKSNVEWKVNKSGQENNMGR